MNQNALRMRWTGIAFEPVNEHVGRKADAEYVVGQVYLVSGEHEQSALSRAHQFAWLHDSFLSLPDHISSRFLDEDQLRRHALIAGGFASTTVIDCATNAEARRWMKILTAEDPYCIVKVEGTSLMRFTARSQSPRSMGSKEFQASKDAVLRYVSNLLDANPKDVEAHEGGG